MSRTVARERAPNKTKTNFMACVTRRRMANWDWRGRIELRLPTFVYSSPCCWPPPPNNVKGFEAPDKHAQSPSFSWVQVGRSVTDRVLDWISSIRNILSKHHFHSVPLIWNGTATYNTTLVVRNGVQVEFASHWSATKRRELIGGLVADEMCYPHSIHEMTTNSNRVNGIWGIGRRVNQYFVELIEGQPQIAHCQEFWRERRYIELIWETKEFII